MYVADVTASPGPGTVIRWLLLLGLLTAATIGIVGVAVETIGWSFGAASAYWVSVFSVVVWAVPSAWLVRSRYAALSSRSEQHLRRLHVPSVAPRRYDDAEERPLVEPVECLADEILVEAAGDRAPAAAVRVPKPRLERRPAPEQVVSPERDAPHPVAGVDHSLPAPSSKPSTPDRSQTRPPLESAPITASDQAVGPAPGERRGGARELAGVLNLYDRVGLSHGDETDSPEVVPYRANFTAGERTLWRELVEDFGADSIDFRGDESGECSITLSNGDLVFYAPERECWMWVVFEGAEDVPSAHPESPLPLHIAADPS